MSQPNVLIVEDDHPTAVLWQHALRNEYTTLFAESVEDSLSIIKKTPIDLILLDLSLKGDQNGIDFLNIVKNDDLYKDIPVFAVTAHAYEYDRLAAVQAGCDEYFAKPINLDEMLERIRSLLLSG